LTFANRPTNSQPDSLVHTLLWKAIPSQTVTSSELFHTLPFPTAGQ
jgi:hypothetical protein